jgi:peptidoglycan hydrolase CwlO-like protein
MKYYLSFALVVLMFITSMGIFGFLSKAHIEQTSAANEGIAQIERIEQELVRQDAVIVRARERIVEAEASVGAGNNAVQDQIDKEQGRIDTAYERIQPAIDEQNTIIQTQLQALEDQVNVYEEELVSLDADLQRLNSVVESYRTELAGTSVASIEAQVQPYSDQIAQLDADLERINTQANEYEQRISEVSIDNSAIEALQQQIADIENAIVVTTNKLQSTERAKIQEGQAVIGVTSDGLFGSNTRTALAKWVDAQQSRISTLQTQAVQLRTQAQGTLDAERTRLTDLVKDLRGTQTDNVLQRKQSLLNAVDSIRSGAVDEAKLMRANIQTKIDTVLDIDIPANRKARQTAQDAITALRQADDPRINTARQAIKDLRASADAQIAASNTLIQRLRDTITIGKDADIEAVIDTQENKIVEANNTIDSLTEDKYTLQAEYRKLEAEVGPIKYLAEFIYGETDQDILEEAVRWVIITIIFVFDPLAVLLLIASQATFEMRRTSKENKNDNSVDDNKHVKYAHHTSSDKTGDGETFINRNTEDTGEESNSTTELRNTAGAGQQRGMPAEGLDREQLKRSNFVETLEGDEDYKAAKKAWKTDHPEQNIKYYKDRYIKGKDEDLPWHQEPYVQNNEQDESSLWSKLQKRNE